MTQHPFFKKETNNVKFIKNTYSSTSSKNSASFKWKDIGS